MAGLPTTYNRFQLFVAIELPSQRRSWGKPRFGSCQLGPLDAFKDVRVGRRYRKNQLLSIDPAICNEAHVEQDHGLATGDMPESPGLHNPLSVPTARPPRTAVWTDKVIRGDYQRGIHNKFISGQNFSHLPTLLTVQDGMHPR